MRRALLTARAASAAVSVGNDGTFGTDVLGRPVIVDVSDPATGDGVVTTAKMYVWNPGTLFVVTGTLSSSTFTYRDVDGPHAVIVGLNTISVNLDVLTGDFIGIVSRDGARIAIGAAVGETVRSTSTVPASDPTPGGTVTISSTFADNRASILGTG